MSTGGLEETGITSPSICGRCLQVARHLQQSCFGEQPQPLAICFGHQSEGHRHEKRTRGTRKRARSCGRIPVGWLRPTAASHSQALWDPSRQPARAPRPQHQSVQRRVNSIKTHRRAQRPRVVGICPLCVRDMVGGVGWAVLIHGNRAAVGVLALLIVLIELRGHLHVSFILETPLARVLPQSCNLRDALFHDCVSMQDAARVLTIVSGEQVRSAMAGRSMIGTEV